MAKVVLTMKQVAAQIKYYNKSASDLKELFSEINKECGSGEIHDALVESFSADTLFAAAEAKEELELKNEKHDDSNKKNDSAPIGETNKPEETKADVKTEVKSHTAPQKVAATSNEKSVKKN